MSLSSDLYAHFGFNSFRTGQEEAIQSLLKGRHTLVVMPTGAGKSLIFQLAALQLEGLALVISPLIALMKDQVDSLVRRNIPATYINSALSAAEQASRLDLLARGKYRLVYIAPERLRNVAFINALRSQKVSLLAVDEAHCISEWGHDFRPDYLHIAQARAALKNPLTVALTATATPQVQQDIIRLLGLGDSARIVTGFNRPNLRLDVKYTSGLPSKLRALNELILPRGADRVSFGDCQSAGAAIIYTGTRRDAEEVTEFAREVVKIPAEYYHAGLLPEERTRIQNDFISGRLNLICATNAFGMGIDRADVRQVIHFSMPGSLEAYYQEAGRAGRDGGASRVTLLYDPEDRALQEFFIASSVLAAHDLRAMYNALHNGGQAWTSTEELSRLTGVHPVQIRVGLAGLERAGALEHLGDEGFRMLFRIGTWDQREIEKAILYGKEHLRQRQAQLTGIVRYAESNSCRRRIILQHFGDAGEAEAADCCDNCRSAETIQGPGKEASARSHGERAALVILDCIRRVQIKVGREKLAQILHGSKAQDILKYRHDKNVYYGKLAIVRQNEIEAMTGQLIELGYIKAIGGEYPVLCLTPRGENAIKRKEAIPLEAPKSLNATEIRRAKAKIEAVGTLEHTAKLFADGLKPEQIARERGLAIGTIYGHCAQLIERGALELSQVIPGEIQNQIEEAIRRAGAANSITPIKMLLPDAIDYGVIRCMLAAKPKGSSQPISHTPPNNVEPSDYELRNTNYEPRNKNHEACHPERSKESTQHDDIESFLSKSHPRPLTGSWGTGWSLGFHSRITGGDWSRSGVGDLTYRLKYQSDTTVLPDLIRQTLAMFQAHPEMSQANLIIPVPASTGRKLNPVRAFCEAFASTIKLPVEPLVIKTRHTRPQKELKTLAQKRANVAGAFALSGEVKGRRVLLVDDLFDTGATLEEITRLLLKHGAACVNVLTLTRTIHSDA
jgi:ATP-dependent DNA helicase RecQ